MSIGHTYAYEYDGAYATIVSVSVLPPPTTLYTWMDVRSSYLTVGLSFSLRHVTDGDPILLGRHDMPLPAYLLATLGQEEMHANEEKITEGEY